MAADVQLVIFKLANEDYGLPISKVQEINRMVTVTRLPQTPGFMEGIINLRGRVIPVVDLRKRFGFIPREHQADTRIMVVDISGQTVGLVVDAVNEVVKISGDCIEPAPSIFYHECTVRSGDRQTRRPVGDPAGYRLHPHFTGERHDQRYHKRLIGSVPESKTYNSCRLRNAEGSAIAHPSETYRGKISI